MATSKCYNNMKDYLHPNLQKIIKQSKYIPLTGNKARHRCLTPSFRIAIKNYKNALPKEA